MTIWKAAVTASLVTLSVAPAWSAPTLEPLIRGWEQFFKLNWEAAERNGKPVVRGYVVNDWGMGAMSIQLLVEGIDAGGQVATQKVAWLGTALPPGSGTYFEVPVPQRSATYRVSVFAFDWMQSGNGSDRR
jgi:hypothetical protein